MLRVHDGGEPEAECSTFWAESTGMYMTRIVAVLAPRYSSYLLYTEEQELLAPRFCLDQRWLRARQIAEDTEDVCSLISNTS
ncbi:hypothetical protein PILCRDRAFT_658541 [Piloderma croceum F 1598]|uniref:Uncharacterized protein n=1 Tax=Piloderma croceum (strain F 1598) TaxID=765440 RepID=A0A0C3AQB6_PILCF|nr:hypothetical protein PILCRDRAFT_658541 [Piloderma croceum F 1598]